MSSEFKSEKVQGVRLDKQTETDLELLVKKFGFNKADIMRKGIQAEIAKRMELIGFTQQQSN